MSEPSFTRKTVARGLLDTGIWAAISTEEMPEQERKQIDQWAGILKAYIEGQSVAARLAECHFTHKQLLRRFNKCVQVADDGRLVGWRGLLPNVLRKPYTRKQPVARGGNATGALHQLFKRIDGLEGYLEALILKKPLPDHVHEPHISNVDLHRQFIRRCKEAGVREDEWPFTARYHGRRSIDGFVADVVANRGQRAVTSRYGDVASSKMCTGTGQDRILLAMAPLDVAEMDAHRLDFLGVIGLPTDSGVAWIPIQRLMLLLICDAKEGAILGYYVVVRRECASEDILLAAMPFVKPWQPRDLEKGMEYVVGGGLPYGTIEGFNPFGVCALMVDNALINLGWAVVDRLTARLGCAVNWGPVRKWMRRPIVERIFGALEQAGFQRVVSTTGSGPKDPRKNDPAKAAVKHRVHLKLLLDLIDIEIARYNSRPSEGRYGLSPLDAVRDIPDPRNGRTLFPVLPPTGMFSPELNILTFRKRISGSQKSGRRPGIKFLRGRYTNPTIAQCPQLVGEKVILHMNPNDIRTAEVFSETSGASLGTAQVGGHWRLHAHSLEFRKLINRFIDDGRLRLDGSDDPVTAMHKLLLKEATEKRKASRPKVSKAATQLARESQATGIAPGTLKGPAASSVQRIVSRRAPRFEHRVGGIRRA